MRRAISMALSVASPRHVRPVRPPYTARDRSSRQLLPAGPADAAGGRQAREAALTAGPHGIGAGTCLIPKDAIFLQPRGTLALALGGLEFTQAEAPLRRESKHRLFSTINHLSRGNALAQRRWSVLNELHGKDGVVHLGVVGGITDSVKGKVMAINDQWIQVKGKRQLEFIPLASIRRITLAG
jgi:hypothetical protein